MAERSTSIRLALAALAMTVGCSSSQLGPGKKDGGAESGPMDPGACDCRLESDGHTLDMSLACLCSRYACDNTPPFGCDGSPHWTVACGLTALTSMTFGGPDVWVYDGAGKLVGLQYSSDSSEFVCPSDPSLKGLVIKGGRFPDSSCPVQTCACDAGDCGPLDAGAAD